MWQELLMASRRQPAPGQERPSEQQQQGGGEWPNGSDRRRMTRSSNSGNDGETCPVEHAALAAVRSVLYTWKAEEQQDTALTQQTSHAASVACPAVLGQRVSNNMKSFDDISTAASTEGGRGDVRTAAAVGMERLGFHAPEAGEHSGLLQQTAAPQQEQRTQQEQHEHFLSSLQKLLQLLQEHEKQQGLKQQPTQQRDGECDQQQQQVSADASNTSLLLKGAGAVLQREEVTAVVDHLAKTAIASSSEVNSHSGASFVAGREVLQQLLSTSAPLSYNETYAYLQSVVRRQQQLQREQEERLQPSALRQRTSGFSEEDAQGIWSSSRNSTCWSAKAGAAGGAACIAEQQHRQQQKEDSKNSCNSLNAALLSLLGSPSPRYLPKPPRGSSTNSSWRSSSFRRSLDDKEWRNSRNSSGATEEEQLYQDWLDHVQGVYIHRFDGTDEYRDDFDPGYRILDIPENEYLIDCSRFKQNPIELVGGLAACSTRPSPPPPAAFSRSRVHLLGSSSDNNCAAPAVASSLSDVAALPLNISSNSSTTWAAAAGAASREGHHYRVDDNTSTDKEKPAAALAAASLQVAAAAVAKEERIGSFGSSTSRSSSPRFGSEAAGPSRVAAATEADNKAERSTYDQEEKHDNIGRDSPSWGEEATGDGIGRTTVAQTASNNWFVECPELVSHTRAGNFETSRSNSCTKNSSSKIPRSCSKEEETRRQNSLFTSTSTTSKNTSITFERDCDVAAEDCRPGGGAPLLQGETAGAEESSEASLKGSVSIEDELADCKVQLVAPSLATMPPCFLAGFSPAALSAAAGMTSTSRCGDASSLGPVTRHEQQQQQPQRCRYDDEEQIKSQSGTAAKAAASDAALREYVKEMHRAAAWRECYCNGDAALFRRKQEQKTYALIETCSCCCSCCGGGPTDNATEPLPAALATGGSEASASASRGEASAYALRGAAAAAAAAEIDTSRSSVADMESLRSSSGGGHTAAWKLRDFVRETAPLEASSGDAFYPVRVAGSQVVGFLGKGQQQQQQFRRQERLTQSLGSGGHESVAAGRGSAAAADDFSSSDQRLLRSSSSHSNFLLHPAAPAVDQRVASHGLSNSSSNSDGNAPTGGVLVATSQTQLSAAAAAAVMEQCGSNRNTSEGNMQQQQQHHHHQLQESYSRADAPGSGNHALMRTRQHDAYSSSNCCCSCGCTACCSCRTSSSNRIDRCRPNSAVFDCFYLKVVFERGKTGFEDHRELVLPSGTLFAGRYIVQQEVGRAAFSRCLQCIDTATKQLVCLKIIKNEKEYMDQSLDEVKTLRYLRANGDADLFHYVRLLDCFYHREHLVLVTELLSHNLYHFSSSLKKMKLPSFWTLGRVQRVARELLLALNFVHKLHVIHCDLKPENVLLRPSLLSDLALYKELAGKHPLTLIREAAAAAAEQAAANQQQQTAAAGDGGGEAAAGGGGGAAAGAGTAGGGERSVSARMRGTSELSAQSVAAEPEAEAAAQATRTSVPRTEAARGGGGAAAAGEVFDGDYYRTRRVTAGVSAQLDCDLESGRMMIESTAVAPEQQIETEAAAGRGGIAVSENSYSGHDVCVAERVDRLRSSLDSSSSSSSEKIQGLQQDCYERPKKQLYLQQQHCSSEQDHLLPSTSQQHNQQQRLHLEQEHQQEQMYFSSPSWCSSSEKESVPCSSGSRVGSGSSSSTVTRDADVSTRATTAVPSSTRQPLSLSKRCGSSPLSPCASVTDACSSSSSSRRLSEQERTASASEQHGRRGGGVRGSLKSVVAAAAAAAAQNISVKLIDFGNSCRTSDALIPYVQSRSYRAPEVLLELPYGSKIDIWSLGCVLFELFTGVVLFTNEGVHSLLARIVGIIGQLPWYMVESSPKRDALFDADGFLYTVIQTNPSSFPASAPPALVPAGGVPAATAAGSAGVAVADVGRPSSSSAAAPADAALAAATDGGGRSGAAGIAAAEKCRQSQHDELMRIPSSTAGEGWSNSNSSSNSNNMCHSRSSCHAGGSDANMPATTGQLQQQEQQHGAAGQWEGGASRHRDDEAGRMQEKQTSTAATVAGGAGDKRIYERASQDPGSYCEEPLDVLTAAGTADRAGEQPAGGQMTADEGAAGCTTAAAPGSQSFFWTSSKAVPEQQDRGGAPAAVATGTASGAFNPTAADNSVGKQPMKEGRRILRFLLPKRSSLKQRLRIDDELFIDFLDHMLKIDPVERWSAERLLLHPFLQKGLYADGL